MIESIQQANVGRKVLRDWLGEGGEPVPLPQAQARAAICLKCPHNFRGSWLWSMATAKAIDVQMGQKAELLLTVDGEEDLKICDKCGCQLKLKVHVPFVHIYRYLADEALTKYPDSCWQKQELHAMTRG